MPSYSYQCRSCNHSWDETRKVSERRTETPCPSCGAVADHKGVDSPGFVINGQTTTTSNFKYLLDKNMDKAKQGRAEHQAIYGKHDEYVVGRPGSRRVIDPERDVSVHGDVGSRSEQVEHIERKI